MTEKQRAKYLIDTFGKENAIKVIKQIESITDQYPPTNITLLYWKGVKDILKQTDV